MNAITHFLNHYIKDSAMTNRASETRVSHEDSLNAKYEETGMCITDDIEQTIEIEMYQHVEPLEEPTDGLEEFIDWDGLECRLAAGDFRSQQEFRAEVLSQFEAADAHFTRFQYRKAIAGLFPEHREMYSALPGRVYGQRVAA